MRQQLRKFTLIAICFLGFNLNATPPQELEEAANAYQQKDYQTAISIYEQLLSNGTYSLELYYNLGSSYFKNNELGKAILNFERVLLLDANNEDAVHNLAVARQQLKDEISEIPAFFLQRWWVGLRQMASPIVWGVLGLLLFWLGVGGLIMWQMGKTREQRKKGFLAGLGLVLFSLLPIMLALSAQAHIDDSNEGIILAEEVSLRSGSDKLSPEIVVLHEGTKVEILDLINSWYKVRLANGEKGWLAAGTFEEI